MAIICKIIKNKKTPIKKNKKTKTKKTKPNKKTTLKHFASF